MTLRPWTMDLLSKLISSPLARGSLGGWETVSLLTWRKILSLCYLKEYSPTSICGRVYRGVTNFFENLRKSVGGKYIAPKLCTISWVLRALRA